VSSELAQDENYDLLGFLAEQVGTAISQGWGAHAINGTGTGQPRGLLADTTAGVTTPAGTFNTTTGADALVDLAHSVAEPYARSAATAWLMKNGTLGAVRKLKASGSGEYVFSPEVAPNTGASGTLLGKPVYADPNFTTVSAGNKVAVFGDFSKLFVRMAGGLRFERSDDFAFE
jgi:HK97 family phage major capsid protein